MINKATILDSLSDAAERNRETLYIVEDPARRLMLAEDAEQADSIAEMIEEGEPLTPDALAFISDALDYNVETCAELDLPEAQEEYQAALDEVTRIRFPRLIETLRRR